MTDIEKKLESKLMVSIFQEDPQEMKHYNKSSPKKGP